MLCPSCNQPLVVLEMDEVQVDHCLGCGGVWLDAGELSLILHGRLDASEEEWLRAGKVGERRCPLCREKMSLAVLPKSGVEIDLCGRRHGVWLDAGELQQIIGAEADDARVAKLRGACAKIFGAEKK